MRVAGSDVQPGCVRTPHFPAPNFGQVLNIRSIGFDVYETVHLGWTLPYPFGIVGIHSIFSMVNSGQASHFESASFEGATLVARHAAESASIPPPLSEHLGVRWRHRRYHPGPDRMRSRDDGDRLGACRGRAAQLPERAGADAQRDPGERDLVPQRRRECAADLARGR
ncbi:hypothetical protein BCEP4_130076 [Burkholderia cepacia]|nr:hypothetical protein BCEP4_130076 [Burkholderia cepacia]